MLRELYCLIGLFVLHSAVPGRLGLPDSNSEKPPLISNPIINDK